MSESKKPTAVEKRAQNRKGLAAFTLEHLKRKLPLRFPCNPDLPPSPKLRYRSAYHYPGFDDLNEEALPDPWGFFPHTFDPLRKLWATGF